MGHGHVIPNPNGVLARCGGPAICAECAKELGGLSPNELREYAQRLETIREPLTEDDLKEMESRAQASNPLTATNYSGGLSFNGPLQLYTGTDKERGEPGYFNPTQSDILFIINARKDVLLLIEEVRRLKDARIKL